MRRALAMLVVAIVAAGCDDAARTGVPATPPLRPQDQTGVRLEVSSLHAQVGDRILVAVCIAPSPADDPIAGVQGSVRFDPTRLRFVGQIAEPPTLAMVGAGREAQGVTTVLSVNAKGLPERTVVLAFQVLSPQYLPGLRFEGMKAVTRGLRTLSLSSALEVATLEGVVPSADSARRLGVREWNALLAPQGLPPGARVPGQIVPGLRYGDVTLNGSINVSDVVFDANVSVGLADLLINPSVDVVIAGNVAPFNVPGLGEVGDPLPPGRNANGTFTIDVGDVVAIANEVVGLDQPVVGEVIPGRAVTPTPDRVVVTDSLHDDRTFFRDTIYELHGTVVVPGSVTLTIEAGTTIEGDVATRGALAIGRGGRIHAVGTRLQPIVFTCNAPTKTPGCWGGINVNGFSLLNNGSGTTGGPIQCPEKIAPGNSGTYGGCIVQDTSGTLRYLRIEYAGMAPAGAPAVAGLALLGVGSGTVAESIQVHASLGDGAFVSGGTVDVRNLFISSSTGAGLRWDDGWVGRVQFLVVQQSGGGPAVRGSNYAADPEAGPRSRPQIYNVTVAGAAEGGGGGILLENGTALILRDAIVLRSGAGLDIDGAATCAQLSAIDVSTSIFSGGTPDLSDDVDCVDEAAYGTDPARSNLFSDPTLIAPFNTLTPDLRPGLGSPASSGGMSAPSGGFFDTTVPYIGAVQPDGAIIPWYAGWTRGWTGAP